MLNTPLERDQFWFRSEFFAIETGEDEETNPRCCGRQLANWLSTALRDDGITVEEVFPEDWGWCVMVKRDPFFLWVGVGNDHDFWKQQPVDSLPCREDVVWTCIVVAEVPLLTRLVRRPDTRPSVTDLLMRVKRLVMSTPSTRLAAQP